MSTFCGAPVGIGLPEAGGRQSSARGSRRARSDASSASAAASTSDDEDAFHHAKSLFDLKVLPLLASHAAALHAIYLFRLHLCLHLAPTHAGRVFAFQSVRELTILATSIVLDNIKV